MRFPGREPPGAQGGTASQVPQDTVAAHDFACRKAVERPLACGGGRVRLLAALTVGVLLGVLLVPRLSSSHYERCAPADIACKSHNTYHASLYAWCGSSVRVCANGVKAHQVARCETGRTFNKWATNGQYKGLWQMGSGERARCGQTLGKDPWTQARAAYCWWRLTSWSAWECA